MTRQPNPQTLRRLTYFAAIANDGSIRKAAKTLGLSVASVSEALAALEDELGVTLAARNTRQLRLTSEGQRVAKIAQQILSVGEELFANDIDPADIEGRVALTLPVELAQSWLPRRLDVFKRRHPKVDVAISASDTLVDLARGPFDLALRARLRPPGEPTTDSANLPLTCVSSKALPLEPHDTGWFTPVTLLSHTGAGRLEVFDRNAGTLKELVFGDVMSVDNKHVALAMVARGMGAALVAQISVEGRADLQECPDHFEFGSLALNIDMRDKKPSQPAIILKNLLEEDVPD